jgi:hypothetical protein
MPSLPSKTARRKHVTPIANLHENDVWQRTFKLLGLQPLTPFADVAPDAAQQSRALAMAFPNDIEAPPAESAEPKKPKITILDLPAETQKDIFKHVRSLSEPIFPSSATMAQHVQFYLLTIANPITINVGVLYRSYRAFSRI